MSLIESYLFELQEIKDSKKLYHASSHLTKTLVPRKSIIGVVPKNVKLGYSTKEWERKAIFAATEKKQAIPFGLERKNLLWPGIYTKEEVDNWKYACYLSVNKTTNILQVHYYNYKPKNSFYLYTVDSKDFKLIENSNAVEQWYSTKEISPLKVQKLFPDQVKGSWKEITKKDWERKKQKYKDKGYYK